MAAHSTMQCPMANRSSMGGPWEERTCWRIFLPLHLTNLKTSDFVGELEWHKQQKKGKLKGKQLAKLMCYNGILNNQPPWQLHPGCHLNSSKIGIPFFFKPWLGVLAESPTCSGLLNSHGRVCKLSSSRRAKHLIQLKPIIRLDQHKTS